MAEMLENSEYTYMQIKYFRSLLCNSSVRTVVLDAVRKVEITL